VTIDISAFMTQINYQHTKRENIWYSTATWPAVQPLSRR